MTAQKPLSHLATISLLVCTAAFSSYSFPTIVQAVPARNAQAQRGGFNPPKFKPPKVGAPRTVGAGTRDGSGACVNGATPLTALIPQNSPSLTVTENPTLLIYIPQTAAKMVRIIIKDDEENEVTRQTLPIPSTDSVVSFNLTKREGAPTFKLGKNYHWYFTLMCPSEDNRSDDVRLDGWFQRTTLRADIMKALRKVAPIERPSVYAANGIWNEAVTTLAELRRESPNDPKIAAYWRELLKSVGLETIAEKPLVQ